MAQPAETALTQEREDGRQFVALKHIRVGDLICYWVCVWGSADGTIQSLLLSNVCYPNFTGVKECAQDADSVRLHFGVLFLVLVCFAWAESSAKKASLMETCLTLVWERARSPAWLHCWWGIVLMLRHCSWLCYVCRCLMTRWWSAALGAADLLLELGIRSNAFVRSTKARKSG